MAKKTLGQRLRAKGFADVPRRLPKPVVKNPLEKEIERKFVAKIEEAGCLCRKLSSPMDSAWCDQLVLGPGGDFALIEFKRPGEDLSPLQADHHAKLIKMGHDPKVFDDWQKAYDWVLEKFWPA